MDDEGDDVVDYDWMDGLDLDIDSASSLLPVESSLDNNANGVGAENHDDDDDAFHTAAEDDADDAAEEDTEEDAAAGSSSRTMTFHLTGGSPSHSDDVNDGDGRPSDYDLALMTQPEEGGGGDGNSSTSPAGQSSPTRVRERRWRKASVSTVAIGGGLSVGINTPVEDGDFSADETVAIVATDARCRLRRGGTVAVALSVD